MALVGTLVAEVELKCPHGDDLLHMFAGKTAHLVPNLVNHHIKKVVLHEGDWGNHGSIKAWTYVTEGKVETFKEMVTIDEENKAVHMKGLEGSDTLVLYKTYNALFELIEKGGKQVMKITLEYEKRNASDPPPQKYLDFVISLVTDLDAQHAKAKA